MYACVYSICDCAKTGNFLSRLECVKGINALWYCEETVVCSGVWAKVYLKACIFVHKSNACNCAVNSHGIFLWNQTFGYFLFADGRDASIELATRHLQEETILRCGLHRMPLSGSMCPKSSVSQAAKRCVQLEDHVGKDQLLYIGYKWLYRHWVS